jgi:Tol biopolymer transport system component
VWNARANLAVMFRDGSSQRTLDSGCSPSWGPKGTLIAFVGDGGAGVYLADLNSGGRRHIAGR